MLGADPRGGIAGAGVAGSMAASAANGANGGVSGSFDTAGAATSQDVAPAAGPDAQRIVLWVLAGLIALIGAVLVGRMSSGARAAANYKLEN